MSIVVPSTSESKIHLIDYHVAPYVDMVRQHLGDDERPVLWLYDLHRSNLAAEFKETLEFYGIKSLSIQGGCTDFLHPGDAKGGLNWHMVSEAFDGIVLGLCCSRKTLAFPRKKCPKSSCDGTPASSWMN